MSTTADLTLDVPVNVKVHGEAAMRKNVVLSKNDGGTDNTVVVRSGKAGRPPVLKVDDIQKITVLRISKPTPPKADASSK